MNRSGYSGDCFDCVTRPEQCAPVGDGHRFSTSSQAKSPRRKAESPTLPLPDTERIRHQTECSWNQTQTGRGATVSEAGNSGDEAEQCRSRCGVVGRSVGGAKHAVPVFYPDNGTTHPTMSANAEDEPLPLLRARDVQLPHEALRRNVVETRLPIHSTENGPRLERQEPGRIGMIVTMDAHQGSVGQHHRILSTTCPNHTPVAIDRGSSNLRMIHEVLDLRQRPVFQGPAVLLEPPGRTLGQPVVLPQSQPGRPDRQPNAGVDGPDLFAPRRAARSSRGSHTPAPCCPIHLRSRLHTLCYPRSRSPRWMRPERQTVARPTRKTRELP